MPRVPDVDITDMKFVLLHDAKGDDGVKNFFQEVWELYVKVSYTSWCTHSFTSVPQTVMNPFHTSHTAIRSSVFDARVRASAKKYL